MILRNNVREKLDKNEKWYLIIGNNDISKDFGYISTNKELDESLTSFFIENEVQGKIRATLGRNIMDDDYAAEQDFFVNLTID